MLNKVVTNDTNQEDTYGKSILQDNDSKFIGQDRSIFDKSKELQREPCAGEGMGQGRYPGRRNSMGNLATQSCSYSSEKSEQGSAHLMKVWDSPIVL